MGNLIFIGRNYGEHALELGNQVPKSLVYFFKPTGCLNNDSNLITLSEHHLTQERPQLETELVLKIGKDSINVSEENALSHISELALGLDFTYRKRQGELKKTGLPWSEAKSFKNSVALTEFKTLPEDSALSSSHGQTENLSAKEPQVSQKDRLSDFSFTASINGKLTQRAKASEMLFSPRQIISTLSNRFTLKKGDMIFTGTPAGVKEVSFGDKIEVRLEDGSGQLLIEHTWTIKEGT